MKIAQLMSDLDEARAMTIMQENHNQFLKKFIEQAQQQKNTTNANDIS